MDENDKNRKKNTGLSAEDTALWNLMMRDVERFETDTFVQKDKKNPENKIQNSKNKEKIRKNQEKVEVFSRDLDKNTEKRFKKGQIPIEACLDLHGMSQNNARTALHDFIARCYESGKRCVMVITGKGERTYTRTGDESAFFESRPGILREKTPDWLHEPPIAGYVLKTHEAKQKHGGSGALYVLLRRKRP